MAKQIPDYAGLRQYRKARETGRYVGVYDGIEQGLDIDGGRWQTVCEDHGHIISHDTLATALAFAAHPLEWCESCVAIADGGTEINP